MILWKILSRNKTTVGDETGDDQIINSYVIVMDSTDDKENNIP